MALLHPVADLVAWLGWYVVPFLVILSAIVFFHELGHYLVARWRGVKIDAFSLGFGPELFARVELAGDALEGGRAAARRLRQISWRRECRERRQRSRRSVR